MEKSELSIRFTYHKPVGDQPTKYVLIRDAGHEFARLVDNLMPDCREKSTAITKIEDAVMWANAGVARRDPRPVD